MSRGVVFSYSFSIYCAAYHGIWCSERNNIRRELNDNINEAIEQPVAETRPPETKTPKEQNKN